MKEIFLQAYGTAWFAAAMYAIQAETMPSWGAFAIGGAAWMLSRIWTRALVPNAEVRGGAHNGLNEGK